MDGVTFLIDFKALALVALCVLPLWLLFRFRQGFVEPSIAFSDVASLLKNRGRVSFGNWPQQLMWLAWLCLVLAFIDPHLLIERKAEKPLTPPTEGVAIYLVLDQSGSMQEQVFAPTDTGMRLLSKTELVKQVTRQFVEGDKRLGLPGHPSDMIGLIYFARGAQVLSPLTLDHAAVLQQLAKFNVIGDKDLDGTSIGYAIFKAASLMAATRHYAEELSSKGQPAYLIKSNVLILLTDGLQDPNPLDKGKRLRNMDVPEAAAYAKEQGVRLYIVNVEPKLGEEAFAPYRHIMQRAAELTGGKFYMVDSQSNLQHIYRDIDKLEKSALPQPENIFAREHRPDLYRRVSFYPSLIMLGLCCLSMAVLLEAGWLRKVP